MSNLNSILAVTVFRHKGHDKDLRPLSEIMPSYYRAFPEVHVDTERQVSAWLDDNRVVQFKLQTSASQVSPVLPRDQVARIEASLDADVIIRHHRPEHSIKLAVFDMDSTLIQQEVIDLLAAHAGVESQVADITSRAMNGELDFSGSLKERVGLLEGLPESVFEQLKPSLSFTEGAQTLIKALKSRGVKTALLSGGFTPLARFIGGLLNIDHVHANDLEVIDKELSGKVAENCIIVNAERKRDLLQAIAASEGVADPEDIMAVGDGANDLLMLRAAGLGIAVNAKPRVQEQAPFRLNCKSMTDILHILNFTRQEIDALA